MNSAGMPHWKANVAPPRLKLWPEYLAGSRPMREASDWMLHLRAGLRWLDGRAVVPLKCRRRQEHWGKRGLLEIMFVRP